MTAFRDALSQLSARIVREHQVFHLSAELPEGDGPANHARSEILRWAQRRSGGNFSASAMQGRGFEFMAAGRNCSAVEVDLPDIHAWALRQEDPDKEVPGRIWTTEAIVWRTPNRSTRFATRLLVGSSEADLDIAPATPGFVRQIIEKVGLFDSGHRILSFPAQISAGPVFSSLTDLMTDTLRRLPIIVISTPDAPKSSVSRDISNLAARLSGAAHVVLVSQDVSWELTKLFGKRLSAFDGAIRLYMPGFDEDADQFSHPLWLGSRLVDDGDAQAIYRQIQIRVAQFSVRSFRIGEEILPFAQLRSYSRKIEQDRLALSGATDSEKLIAADMRIAALTKELEETRELERLAIDEEYKARIRAEESESRERKAIFQVQSLLEKLSDADVNGDVSAKLPEKWEDFEDWVDFALAGRVALAAPARRGCKRALFSDVEQAARCLLWLANECRTRLLQGGGALRDHVIEEGIRNSLCGSDEFMFDWQSQRININWHIKTGGNSRAPENCLRIYYGWDEHTQQIIIADMPAHRHTSAS